MCVIRTIHNRDNPYVMLSKSALWDQDLPLECVGLWARCMSRPDGWVFNVSELSAACGLNVQTMRKRIKKLIELGYALRIGNKNESTQRFEKCDYLFFEFKLTEEETEKYVAEFKKCLPQTKKPSTALPCAAPPRAMACTLLNKEERDSSSLRSEDKEEHKEGPRSSTSAVPTTAPPSSESGSLTDFFLSKLKERSPAHKLPNLPKWYVQMDAIIRIDKRPPEQVREVIAWAAQAKWYKSSILSPDKLRRMYDEILLKMQEEADQDRVRANRAYALKVKEKYPDSLKALNFNAKYAMNSSKAKELPFDMDPQAFKNAFVTMFGGTYHEGDV